VESGGITLTKIVREEEGKMWGLPMVGWGDEGAVGHEKLSKLHKEV